MASVLHRVLAPWALRPSRLGRVLRGFARAEQASAIDLQQAAAATSSVRRAALYLRHAEDESRHARRFRDMAAELDGAADAYAVDTEDLYERLGEERFLAFVFHGESRGCAQFEAYEHHFQTRDARVSALFAEILEDERRHRSYSHALLVELAGERGAAAAVRRVRVWESWRGFRRAGRTLASALYTIGMWVIYLAMIPIGVVAGRAPRGFR